MSSLTGLYPASPRRRLSEASLLALAEKERRSRAGLYKPKWDNLVDYARAANPRFVLYKHVEALFEYLEAIARGDLKRLMIFEPPRHGKSESVSRIFPGYYLSRNPQNWVGLGSYAAELAHDLSREARDYYIRAGGEIRHDVRAVKQWKTHLGGGMWAAGVGGSITGKGFDLGINDDLIKSEQEAASERIRTKTWNWRNTTWATRKEPDAAEIMIMTRWHEQDPAGRQLEQEIDEPEGWTILNLAAIAPDEPAKFPSTCFVVPDWRKPGEALCPERFDVDTLAGIRARIKEYYWTALYGQSPTSEDGNAWKKEWFRSVDEIPDDLTKLESDWDTAYTKQERNSASAFVEAGLAADGRPFITDFDFRWLEFDDLVNWMKERPGRHNVEAKASGKSVVQTLTKQGIPAAEVNVQGGLDKEARVRLIAPFASNGVYVYAPLLERLLHDPKQGILKVPNGPHDDVSDTLTQMLNRLFMAKAKTPRMVIAG